MHKCALITGASSGIGRALAQLMAEKKIALILTGRDQARLEETAQKATDLGAPSVQIILGDLSSSDGIQAICESIKKNIPDLVINNAGFGAYGDVIDLEVNKQQEMIDVNVSALFQIAAQAAKTLLEHDQEGVILNVSSVASIPAFPGFAVYSASKSFVNQFSISMDYELRDEGIRVLVACPGVISTNFRENAGGRPISEEREGIVSAEEAAKAIWWQIEKRKSIYFFPGRFRTLVRLVRYLLPSSFVAYMLRQTISSIKKEPS